MCVIQKSAPVRLGDVSSSQKGVETVARFKIDPLTGRRDYSQIKPVLEMPNLLEIQLKSFDEFLQRSLSEEDRRNIGLQAVFKEIFPISDLHSNFTLEFLGYSIGEPKYSILECQERDMTFAVPLKAALRLIIRESVDDQKRVKDIIQQEVYLGELPLITDKGTFIINGAERVIVCQLHRSPGVYFADEIHANGKRLFSGRIIPSRGSWVEFSLDSRDVMYVHIDRKRKMPVTVLLRALGYSSNDEILRLFSEYEQIDVANTPDEGLHGRITTEAVVDVNTGEILIEQGETISRDAIRAIREAGIEGVSILNTDSPGDLQVLTNTLNKDTCEDEAEALIKIYNILRPGDQASVETARALLERLFFNPKRYHLGNVGRHRINNRLDLDVPEDQTVLCNEDIIAIVRYILRLKSGQGNIDDIDHLGNRRIRSVGELLAQQLSTGLSRMARTIRERMALQDADTITPYDLINARTISSVVSTFFGSSQLSQFMDQVNPLGELTNKRRLSALGPGGLTRDRAGIEVRDVHHTHYGRMCTIETPEGPNIGLITSLCTYTRVNEFGFLETPYRKVVDGTVSRDIEYLSADREDLYTIAQANAPLDGEGLFMNPLVRARRRGDYVIAPVEQIDYMDVAPIQIVSVAASLIPFLEHDDANRALMGSNMQRQAVPLMVTEAPLIGTGMERKAAVDSGSVIVSKRAGTVAAADANRIVVEVDTGTDIPDDEIFDWSKIDEYRLTKFRKSNQDTCINERPRVRPGDRVEAGQVIADGQSIDSGELALGKNVLVAFMPWNGYNFEDAIVLSERVVREDVFTSIHIQEMELQVRDTKRGAEEITRELPNVSDDAVRNLDDDGIIIVGADVHPGDILVGKVTPKGETELSPEERLLRAIFGEKAGDVRDASLKASTGMVGTVVDVKVFSRREKDDRVKREIKKRVAELKQGHESQVAAMGRLRDARLREIMAGQDARDIQDPRTGRYVVPRGKKLDEKTLDGIDFDAVILDAQLVEDDATNVRIWNVSRLYRRKVDTLGERLDREIEKANRGDELAPGIVKLVKVYVARKRVLSVGDKMAGRHGNKGVVSRIVPIEDMPYLADGTAVDIVLNPLGVPSRMNLGQILETHLGWAAHGLGVKIACPVFDGPKETDIKEALTEAGLPESGRCLLYDGMSGEAFDDEVTVGYIYMLKLSHLVDDKIHARSIGPYSLVTQQPLGGKAQFGGQRFGEMEVWALEAYGAAYALQELLTVKSDDVNGRSRIYEAIVKGDNPPEPGIPESFNVLIKELQSLGLNVQLLAKSSRS